MNRNNTRVLSEDQIRNLTLQVAEDLRKYPSESAEALINLYLNGDAQGMFDTVSDWIEYAEDEIKRQEDNLDYDDQFTPHYNI
jgi:hypothetical protein